jgi:hypothetical protein
LAKLLKYPWDFGQIIEIPLGFWPNYPFEVGMGFSWAFLGFSILDFFGLF